MHRKLWRCAKMHIWALTYFEEVGHITECCNELFLVRLLLPKMGTRSPTLRTHVGTVFTNGNWMAMYANGNESPTLRTYVSDETKVSFLNVSTFKSAQVPWTYFLNFKNCFPIDNHCKRWNVFSDLLKITRIFWTLLRVCDAFVWLPMSGNNESFFCEHSGKTAEERRNSFSNWPKQSLPTPDQLAQAGFEHTPYEGVPDCVYCERCDKYVEAWEPGDLPEEYHETSCSFYKKLPTQRPQTDEDTGILFFNKLSEYSFLQCGIYDDIVIFIFQTAECRCLVMSFQSHRRVATSALILKQWNQWQSTLVTWKRRWKVYLIRWSGLNDWFGHCMAVEKTCKPWFHKKAFILTFSRGKAWYEGHSRNKASCWRHRAEPKRRKSLVKNILKLKLKIYKVN